MSRDISINVPILARVEGEGALELHIRDNQITTLELKIYEPPRLFEKFLEGRSYTEVLDIVARICGICPVAYQMSATQAIEGCFAMPQMPWVREMRRLFYCGEWLESHSLHIHFLALPDFLGFSSVTEMAKVYPDEVKRGMRLQGYGNELIRLLGGRSVHPVGACIGGFYKAPDKASVHALLQKAQGMVKDCEALIRWLASVPLPDNTQDFTSVSLYHPLEYPMNEGRIVSNRGLNIAVDEFPTHFKEHQVPYSTALHCLLDDEPYLVGPLARVNHCFGHLPIEIHTLLQELQLNFPSQNMCHSVLARAIEVYYAVLESIRIMSHYEPVSQAFIDPTPKPGIGFGATEAPRGLLWQRYELGADGLIQSAVIVPPTSQNQARIEADLHQSLHQFGLQHDEGDLRAFSEMIIRNYDPCISCSTHFLKLKVHHQ